MPFLIFFATLAFLLVRLAPSLSVGDAGELIAASKILGVAHSPGYPLYLLGGKIFSMVPLGSMAFRLNFFSAVCMAAAASVLLHVWRKYLGLNPWLAAAGLAALLSDSRLIRIATESEVFSLMILSVLLIVWAVLEGRLLAASFLAGLFLGNHHTLVLWGPGCLILAWPQIKGSLRRWAACLAFVFLGFSIYAYLPAAASRKPALNWGNPDNYSRFARVFLRKDYGTFRLTNEDGQEEESASHSRSAQAARLAQAMMQEPFPALLALLGFAGALWGLFFGAARGFSAACLVFFFFSGPFFLFLGHPPFDAQTSGALERFYALPFLALALAWPVPWTGAIRAVKTDKFFSVAALAAWTALFAFTAGQRHNFLAYDYGRNLLRSLPPSSYFFMEGGDDTMYSMAYFLLAEGRRPDLGSASQPETLRVRDRAALVFPSLYGFEFRETPRAAREAMRASVESRLASSNALYYQTLNLNAIGEGLLVPVGLVQRRKDSMAAETPPLWGFYSMRGLKGPAREHYRERSLIPYYFHSQAQRLALENRGEEALRLWKAAYAKAPDAIWIKSNLHLDAGFLGIKLHGRGDYRNALELLRFARRVGPQEPSHAANICVTLEKTSGENEVDRCYASLVKDYPGYSNAFRNRGIWLLQHGKKEEARAAIERYAALGGGAEAEMLLRRTR